MSAAEINAFHWLLCTEQASIMFEGYRKKIQQAVTGAYFNEMGTNPENEYGFDRNKLSQWSRTDTNYCCCGIINSSREVLLVSNKVHMHHA